MDYKELLEMAGATVLAYEEFGSYQGDWVAKVEYNGLSGYTKDFFGSCSGCDALISTLCYLDHEDINYNWHDNSEGKFEENCEICQKNKREIILFAQECYLCNIIDYETARNELSKNCGWDMEADEMVLWIDKVEKQCHYQMKS